MISRDEFLSLKPESQIWYLTYREWTDGNEGYLIVRRSAKDCSFVDRVLTNVLGEETKDCEIQIIDDHNLKVETRALSECWTDVNKAKEYIKNHPTMPWFDNGDIKGVVE